MPTRAQHLADRIDQGASLLGAFARELTEQQWRTVIPPDGRTAGVIVHHVASMYPIELDVVHQAVQGRPITEVSWALVAQINAAHAQEHAGVAPRDALALLELNSRRASASVRRLTDRDLDRAVPFSLSFGAPVTVQFIIEDHPLRHPWHHLARIRDVLERLIPERSGAGKSSAA